MNNKILIGSIIAVVVLIGVSFTSVVGYRSVDSDVKASPLFNIRTSRAIDEENKDFSCGYVGKGEESIILIQRLDNITVSQQKLIDKISKMDDNTFNRFIKLGIRKIHQFNKFKYVNINELIVTLHNIRINPDAYYSPVFSIFLILFFLLLIFGIITYTIVIFCCPSMLTA